MTPLPFRNFSKKTSIFGETVTPKRENINIFGGIHITKANRDMVQPDVSKYWQIAGALLLLQKVALLLPRLLPTLLTLQFLHEIERLN